MLRRPIRVLWPPRSARPSVLGLVALLTCFAALPALAVIPEPEVVLAADLVVGTRLFVATGSNGVSGRLFTADPATGATAIVGGLRVGTAPIGITGLAVHPSSGILYGSTAVLSPNHGGSLVTINTTTAAATPIGSFSPPSACVSGSSGASPSMQDLAFRADGTLFGFCGSALFVIDIETGSAVPVGTATYTGGTTSGGRGLTFGPLVGSPQDLWVAPRSGTGAPIFRIRASNGAILQTVPLSGVTFGPFDTLTALTTDSVGGLLAAKSRNNGSSAVTLVAIDVRTGEVSARGNLPNDTDAIALDLVRVKDAGSSPTSNGSNDRDDGPSEKRRQRRNQQQQGTNSGGRDDIHTEGNVVGLRCSLSDPVPAPPKGFIVKPDAVPYVLIANLDGGIQQVVLGREGAACGDIGLGAYLEADGTKESEEFFEAEGVRTSRIGRASHGGRLWAMKRVM
jgi:hypothetical protein